MGNKAWAGLLAIILVLLLGLSAWLFRPGTPAGQIQIWSDGKLLYTLPLNVDRTVEVRSNEGVNIVTIKDGAVAVTEATCPDGHCMKRGFCSNGPQIICLPNRLVIRFLAGSQVDSVVG